MPLLVPGGNGGGGRGRGAGAGGGWNGGGGRGGAAGAGGGWNGGGGRGRGAGAGGGGYLAEAMAKLKGPQRSELIKNEGTKPAVGWFDWGLGLLGGGRGQGEAASPWDYLGGNATFHGPAWLPAEPTTPLRPGDQPSSSSTPPNSNTSQQQNLSNSSQHSNPSHSSQQQNLPNSSQNHQSNSSHASVDMNPYAHLQQVRRNPPPQ